MKLVQIDRCFKIHFKSRHHSRPQGRAKRLRNRALRRIRLEVPLVNRYAGYID